jgi:hypothetical protein
MKIRKEKERTPEKRDTKGRENRKSEGETRKKYSTRAPPRHDGEASRLWFFPLPRTGRRRTRKAHLAGIVEDGADVVSGNDADGNTEGQESVSVSGRHDLVLFGDAGNDGFGCGRWDLGGALCATWRAQ